MTFGGQNYNHFIDLSGLSIEQLQERRAEVQRRIEAIERSGFSSHDQMAQLKVIGQQIVDEMHDRNYVDEFRQANSSSNSNDADAVPGVSVIQVGGPDDSGLVKQRQGENEPDGSSKPTTQRKQRRKSSWD